MTYELSEQQVQESAHKEKSKRNRRKKHKQHVSVVPNVDPVGNQLKNVVSQTLSSQRMHENKSKKKKKEKNKSGDNAIDPKEEESLNLHRRKLLEAAIATHETASKEKKKRKKKKKKKKCDQELQSRPDMHNIDRGQDANEDAQIRSETSKNPYMEGLGLEVAQGVTIMIKKKANKKKKRQEEMEKLKNKNFKTSFTRSDPYIHYSDPLPLHKVRKRKLPDIHEAGNLIQDVSQVEKRPRIDDESKPTFIEKDAGERKKRKKRKKKTKPPKIALIVDAQRQHLETQIESITSRTDTNSNSLNFDESNDPDPIDDPDSVEGEFFPTGDEVADDDISVYLDEEEKAIKKLQRRNEDALAMLRSTKNICKSLKKIVPQACLNLPSKPTNEDGKESMLNKIFEWPDISKNKFPILHKVIDWIFTKESFVVPGKYFPGISHEWK